MLLMLLMSRIIVDTFCITFPTNFFFFLDFFKDFFPASKLPVKHQTTYAFNGIAVVLLLWVNCARRFDVSFVILLHSNFNRCVLVGYHFASAYL